MKNMVITGTTRGIGKYLAEYFLEKGYRVRGIARNESDIRHLNYEHFQFDVTDEEKTISFFRSMAVQGGCQYLVNNAAIASMNHAMLTPTEVVRRILEVNTISTFVFCREAARSMMRRGFGRIVNFSTVAVPYKLEGEAAYVASKAAVETLTSILAKEFAGFGVRINSIGPTPIETSLIKSVPKEKIEALVNKQAVKRLGTPADVANVIDFFFKDESEFITGQTIYLGGVS